MATTNTTILQQVETAVSGAEQAVASFIATVEKDGAAVVAWIEKEIPAVQPAFAALAADAKAGAQILATAIQADASGAISALAADIETALANFANASKMPTQAGQALSVVETDAITLAEQLANAAVSVGLTKVLALVAPAL